MAPELHDNKRYQGKSVDIFALGVILYAMRACSFPFDTKATQGDKLYSHIANKKFDLFW